MRSKSSAWAPAIGRAQNQSKIARPAPAAVVACNPASDAIQPMTNAPTEGRPNEVTK